MLKKSIDQMSKLIQSMQVPANFHGFSFATNLAAMSFQNHAKDFFKLLSTAM